MADTVRFIYLFIIIILLFFAVQLIKRFNRKLDKPTIKEKPSILQKDIWELCNDQNSSK